MSDFLGTLADHPMNLFHNLKMVKELKKSGLEIIFFNPSGPRMSILFRLHIKMCAIDNQLLFLGGSNIGDYYTGWQDTNLRIDGNLGPVGHDLFDFVVSKSTANMVKQSNRMDISQSCCGDVILGSVNIESRGLANNFELCVELHDPRLANELSQNF